MAKSISDAVLTNLEPNVFYRTLDVAEMMGIEPKLAGSALREIAKGGGN